MSAQKLLDRLEGVRRRGQSQWSARCSAHDDKGPSLSVRELDDGRVLLHCFAGCAVGDVLGAVGLEMADLFPDRLTQNPPRRPRLVTVGQAFEILKLEATVVLMAAADVAAHRQISDADLHRVAVAAGRIRHVVEESAV